MEKLEKKVQEIEKGTTCSLNNCLAMEQYLKAKLSVQGNDDDSRRLQKVREFKDLLKTKAVRVFFSGKAFHLLVHGKDSDILFSEIQKLINDKKVNIILQIGICDISEGSVEVYIYKKTKKYNYIALKNKEILKSKAA